MESAGLVAAAPPAAPLDASGLDADERSFSEFYYRLHPTLLKVAERYVDPETARDAESSVLLDLWRRWAQLDAGQRSDEYVIRAVRYKAIDALKRQRAFTYLDEAEEAVDRQTADEHDAAVGAASVREVLEETLAAMPPGRRAVLRYFYEERCTYQEAATALGLHLGTIKTHYRLAMADLRAAFVRAGHRVIQGPRALLPDPKGGADHD